MKIPLTVGSLFSGIGGFDLGFERAGFDIRWMCEIDPFCRKVLRKHWPEVPIYEDIRTLNGDAPRVDIIVGGDPCQQNSNARRGFNTTSPSLAHEFLRIVGEYRPRFVLRENPSRVRADAPSPWYWFRAGLERLGYAVLPFRLRACCFGLDHQRDRLFLLAELPDTHPTRLSTSRQHRASTNTTSCSEILTTPAGVRGLQPTSEFLRSVHGIPDRVDRIKSLGNSCAPQEAQYIARCILHHAEEQRLIAQRWKNHAPYDRNDH